MTLPEEFVLRIKPLLKEQWDSFVESLSNQPSVSIRLNPSKSDFVSDFQKVPWTGQGYYLDSRPQFIFDPLFHAGLYYPQEASSMFIEQIIKRCMSNDNNLRVLDLCAAPGGKSTHLLSLLPPDSLLVSNEVIRSRAIILSENITKWGYPNCIVSNNDPADFSKINNFFDVVLVDAPCSGEGMFRKDEKAIEEWSEANVRLCKSRQQRIVSDVWNSLKPGGVLIYSTCTYNLEENEENVRWICEELGADPLDIDVPDSWGITRALKYNIPVFRFFPNKIKGEGFFTAILRKRNTVNPGVFHTARKERIKQKGTKEIFPDKCKSYLLHPEKFSFISTDNKFYAFPSACTDDLNFLSSQLKIISSGIFLGEQKGKDFIPSHSLALSNRLNKSAFVSYEVDWQTAIAYLRKENIHIKEELPKGIILLTYKSVPIGFVKNIGTRVNNLYPSEWRIRSQAVPSVNVSVIE